MLITVLARNFLKSGNGGGGGGGGGIELHLGRGKL